MTEPLVGTVRRMPPDWLRRVRRPPARMRPVRLPLVGHDLPLGGFRQQIFRRDSHPLKRPARRPRASEILKIDIRYFDLCNCTIAPMMK